MLLASLNFILVIITHQSRNSIWSPCYRIHQRKEDNAKNEIDLNRSIS